VRVGTGGWAGGLGLLKVVGGWGQGAKGLLCFGVQGLTGAEGLGV
jgi:hypothetical protein